MQYKSLFQDQSKNVLQQEMKTNYAKFLQGQILEKKQKEHLRKKTEESLNQQQVINESPFEKDRIKQLMKLNQKLISKPIFSIDEFVQQQNNYEKSRPKTRFQVPSLNTSIEHKTPKGPSRLHIDIPLNQQLEDKQKAQNLIQQQVPQYQLSQSYTPYQNCLQQPYQIQGQQYAQNKQDSYLVQQHPYQLSLNQGQQIQLPQQTLTNRSGIQNQSPPPNIGNEQYYSTYDLQHSKMAKQEKSNFQKELNNINQLFKQQNSKQITSNSYQEELEKEVARKQQEYQQTSNLQELIQESEQLRYKETERRRLEELKRKEEEEIYRQREMERRIQEQLQRKKDEEEYKQRLKNEIEEELEHQKRMKQQEVEIQTEAKYKSTGIQHNDQNAVTATEYMKTLRELSSSIIDMKNQFIEEQLKLEKEIIQLKDKAIEDVREKQRLELELQELELRHKAFRVWEGEYQRKLILALEKNAPLPKIDAQYLDYRKLNPSIKKITRFKDQTLGYEYDEQNGVLSKSNYVPLKQRDDQRQLHELRQEVPVLPEELEQTNNQLVPSLQYSNPITKELRIRNLNDRFYDYQYQQQSQQPQQYRREDREQQQYQGELDPNRVLLENDRRLYELEKIDPNGDQEQIKELYNYL